MDLTGHLAATTAGSGRRRQHIAVGLLALFAALRVGLLAACMPIFVHLDEDAHFDTVHKYARGAWPAPGGDRYDLEVVEIGARFQSGDWLQAPDPDPRKHVLPGVFLDPALRARDPAAVAMAADPATVAAIGAMLEQQLAGLRERSPNYEAFEPPVYGLLASSWLRIGRWFGVHSVGEVLWVRLLGMAFAALAVVLTWRLARIAVPGAPAVALGAAGVIAVAGQDVVACVNNDAPGVVTGPLVLLCAAWLCARPRKVAAALAGGAVLAVPLLTKLTTLHASAAAFVLLALTLRADLRRWWPILLGFVIPLAAWVIYARVVLGMWHGGEHKVALTLLGAQTWDGFRRHPMFTLAGFCTFLVECMTQLWRGDLWYYGRPLRAWWSDTAYLVVPVIGLLALPRRRPPELRTARGVGVALGGGVFFAFALMAAISLAWNFDHASFPTRDHPYFTQGRMISACLPSLSILVVLGFTRLLGVRGGVIATVLFALVALVSESVLNLPIYTSAHSVWRLL